jgi:hypothetical protein
MEQTFTTNNGELVTLSYISETDTVNIKCASLDNQTVELGTMGSLEDGTINHVMTIQGFPGEKWQDIFADSGIELDLRNFFETNKVNK